MAGKSTNSKGKTAWLNKHGLSDWQRMFVLNYLADPNATKAAKDAGYKNPNKMGVVQMVKHGVAAAIEEGRSQVEAKAQTKAEEVTAMWHTLATADATELTQNINGPCRYCHGLDHEYQWKTAREFREAFTAPCYDLYTDPELRDAALQGEITDERLPTDQGGYGYRVLADINVDCPECGDMGIEVVRMADTRNLSPAARLLFDGVEVTQNGKKIRITSRETALDRLAKSLGMYAGKVEDEKTNPLARLMDRINTDAQAIPVREDKRPL
jgi:hypothetical protein